MLCQNCGESKANVRYTQIINREKKEFNLCDKCAHKLGIGMVDFKIPSHFSGFLGDFFSDFNSNVFTSFDREFDSLNPFIDDEKMPIDTFLLELNKPEETEGVNQILKDLKENVKSNKQNKNLKSVINNEKEDNNQDMKLKLEQDLQKAIKEERYEDAAKIRDQIKKIDK